MKIIINILFLTLVSSFVFSQQKSLSDLKSELKNKAEQEKVNYIIISRTISVLNVKENKESEWVNHYKLFLIKDALKNVIVEEFNDGVKSTAYQIKKSKIFRILNDDFSPMSLEKLNDFEYEKNGSKVYLVQSNSGEMEIEVLFNKSIYHNKFDEFLLEFSSNSKMKIVKLISIIEQELKPFHKLHPFYVNR